jgi:hypothetical protein
MVDRESPVDATLGAAYRALPDEGPPPAMDAAILAAARASVAAKPRTQWAVPVSLAAVLVLSVAVSVQVSRERPVIEAEWAAMAPIAPVPLAKAPPVSVPDPAPPAAPPVAIAAIAPKRSDAPTAPRPAPDAAGPTPVAPQPAAAAEPARESVASQASAAAPRMAARAQSAPAMADMAKGSAEAEHRALPATPEAWLQGIADLRAQARHAEADERLAEFHRRYPGYTITPEMRQKITAPR